LWSEVKKKCGGVFFLEEKEVLVLKVLAGKSGLRDLLTGGGEKFLLSSALNVRDLG